MWLLTCLSLVSLFLLATHFNQGDAKIIRKSHFEVTWTELEYDLKDLNELKATVQDDAEMTVVRSASFRGNIHAFCAILYYENVFKIF
jgi:hypothetical protein